MSLDSSDSTKIAVLIETSTAYGRGLLRGISRYAVSQSNWSLYLKPSGKDGALSHLKDWNVDGLLVRVHDRRLADRVLSAGIPAVDLGYAIPDLFPWKITNDQQQVGQLAAEHLLGCGLKHFAFCGWGPAHPTARVWEQARLQSFRKRLAKCGYDAHAYEWPQRATERTWSKARKHLAAWLRALPKPVGVMAANDERALELLDAAHSAGLAVPAEIALIGVDNDEVLCEATSPNLSSVALNLEQIGHTGAALLHRLIRGRSYPRRPIHVSPLGVVARASTDVVATDDEIVVTAIRYIHQHIHQRLNVADVLKAVAVSRKTLEVRFSATIGRTPYEEIIRRRILRVKELLIHTDWPLKRIAQQSGFPHLENLHNVFRREVGQTPGGFRAQHSASLGGSL